VSESFSSALAAEVERNGENLFVDNYDTSRLGPYRSEKHPEDLIGPRGDAPADEVARRMSQFADVSFLYTRLGDEESRELLVKLFAYRSLGYRKVKLPRNTDRYWQDIQGVRATMTADPPLQVASIDLRRAFYDLRPLGHAGRMYSTPARLAATFIQRKHEYARGAVACKVARGETAIDAGSGFGETTLCLAHQVGAGGRVLSLEFNPANLAVLRRNLHKHLYSSRSPFGAIDPVQSPEPIDYAAADRRLRAVHFVKMDVGGGSASGVLQGAERTLRKHRPKVAISLHRPNDFIAVPQFMESLGLDYVYYLGHHTIYLDETVLFAVRR
jgi:precorrin-6B methylase 2